jgi:DnaJ like chaperone protein
MSYEQIFRRLNRLFKSTMNDVMDRLSSDDQELNEFDKELKTPRDAGTNQERSGSQSSGRSSQSQYRPQGDRKPGERDDAHYYAVLGLAPSATVEEIKRSYKKLMSQYHPDKVASLSQQLQKEAAEKAKAINEAYQIIERRRKF